MKTLFITLNILFVSFLQVASQVTLNLHLLIEGYYTGNGMMDNFGAGGCLNICGISLNPNDVDTIKVSLVDPANLNYIESVKGILQTNGYISLNYSTITPGSFCIICVEHRNALKTWSASPVSIQSNTNYDFCTSDSMAFRKNMTMSFDNQGWMFYSGDISDENNLGFGVCFQDGITDGGDYLEMENALAVMLQGYQCQDITGDAIVDSTDWLIEEQAVAIIRIAYQPDPININEINNSILVSNSYKCVSINGEFLIPVFPKTKTNRNCSIYDLSGRLILKTNIEKISNHIFDIWLPDGVYVVIIEG